MAGNIPAAGGPGSEDQPVASIVLYHNSEKNAIPFIEKIFHFPGEIFSHNQYMRKQGILYSGNNPKLCTDVLML